MIADYKICIGLYAYMRQVELSLDRFLPADTTDIKNYFLSVGVYHPTFVANYFDKLNQGNEGILFIDHKRSFLLALLKRNKILIRKEEMNSIIKCLHEVSRLINSSNINASEVINIRILVRRISWSAIGKKLTYEARLKAHSVTHYHENTYMKFYKIDEILGSVWIE